MTYVGFQIAVLRAFGAARPKPIIPTTERV